MDYLTIKLHIFVSSIINNTIVNTCKYSFPYLKIFFLSRKKKSQSFPTATLQFQILNFGQFLVHQRIQVNFKKWLAVLNIF